MAMHTVVVVGSHECVPHLHICIAQQLSHEPMHYLSCMLLSLSSHADEVDF